MDLGGENSGKGTLGISVLRRENNIKIYFKEMRWGAWTRLSWLRIGIGSVCLRMS